MNLNKGFIIIPAYNEQDHISKVVQPAVKLLPVLVIDDGSTDKTSEISRQNGAEVFMQIPNQGKGEALKRGFREAIALNCEFVITLDADGQHDVQEIEKFISLYKAKNSDLIIGYRNFSEMPFTRRMANTIGGWFFSWAIGRKIIDNQSGYRLMSRRLMEKVLDSKEAGFEFEVDVITTCVQTGFLIDWVPIRTIYDDEKSHISPIKHTKNFFRVVFQTRKKMKS